MLNNKKFIPVRAISFKGKLLVGILRTFFRIRRFFGGTDWDSILPEHHEDPRTMSKKELLYFAHKYYYRSILKSGEAYMPEVYFRSLPNLVEIQGNSTPHESLTLSAGGDLMPYYCINKESCSNLWDDCGDFFFNADIVTANLETPISVDKAPSLVPEVMLNNMYFNGSSEMFEVFSGPEKFHGFDVLSVANNHSLDQGVNGLFNTLNFLEEKNILYCGAALSKDKLDEFPVIHKNGISVAFLAATFSLNMETLDAENSWMVNHLQLNTPNPNIDLLKRQAELAREKGVDFIVAHLHMGCAYQPYPSQHSVNTVHAICKATGIDIVLGGHPHNPQPIEHLNIIDPFSQKAKQCFIIYSLGDFVAYDIFKWCHVPAMLKFTLSKTEDTCYISKIEIKLAYMHAKIEKSKVVKLTLKGYKKLVSNQELLDEASGKEFAELDEFVKSYLLPGNYENYLV